MKKIINELKTIWNFKVPVIETKVVYPLRVLLLGGPIFVLLGWLVLMIPFILRALIFGY